MLVAEKRLSDRKSLNEGALRRATSDLYYAMFHKVCEELINPLLALSESKEPDAVYRETLETLYRIPDHAYIEKQCKELKEYDFCDAVINFARHLTTMKNKRHNADYKPFQKFAISDVKNDISVVKSLLAQFDSVDPVERARFAYFVALKSRRNT